MIMHSMCSMFYTSQEIMEILGIGRTACYEYLDKVMALGEPFSVLRIGKLYRIPKSSFDAWVTNPNIKKENRNMDFASSGYVKDYFQGQIPQIIRALKRIADGQEKLIELQMQSMKSETTSAVAEIKAEGVIYVCYEENSTALYIDAGNINHMFVTADITQAMDWAKRSLLSAEAKNYRPISEDEMNQFFSDVGSEQYASVWVYRNRDENAKENYGICIDSFDLSKSADALNSIFG